jgi:hypothetical protein
LLLLRTLLNGLSGPDSLGMGAVGICKWCAKLTSFASLKTRTMMTGNKGDGPDVDPCATQSMMRRGSYIARDRRLLAIDDEMHNLSTLIQE